MIKMYPEESGRSMVEMLGVLAIVGVLSIGGISSYSKAMAKNKINKTLDQLSFIITNIRTLYTNQISFSGLNNEKAILYEVVSKDIVKGSQTLVNVFAGTIEINAVETRTGTDIPADCAEGNKFCPGFRITYTGMDRNACAAIASSDWGSTASGGLIAFAIGQRDETPIVHYWNDGEVDADHSIPVTYAKAYEQCGDLNSNSITWVYN